MEESQENQSLYTKAKHIGDEIIGIHETVHEITNNEYNMTRVQLTNLRRRCRLLCRYITRHCQEVETCAQLVAIIDKSLNIQHQLLLIEDTTLVSTRQHLALVNKKS